MLVACNSHRIPKGQSLRQREYGEQIGKGHWNNRGADRRGFPEKYLADNAATFNCQCAAVLQVHRQTGKRQLLRFSIFVHVRLLNSSPYRREKGFAGRRGAHVA